MAGETNEKTTASKPKSKRYQLLCNIRKKPIKQDETGKPIISPLICKRGEEIDEKKARELFGKSDEDFERSLKRGLLAEVK